VQEGVDAEGDPDCAEDSGGGPQGGSGGHCVSAWDTVGSLWDLQYYWVLRICFGEVYKLQEILPGGWLSEHREGRCWDLLVGSFDPVSNFRER
jgi:hypothetical protein